jgi:hypothetical protein
MVENLNELGGMRERKEKKYIGFFMNAIGLE